MREQALSVFIYFEQKVKRPTVVVPSETWLQPTLQSAVFLLSTLNESQRMSPKRYLKFDEYSPGVNHTKRNHVFVLILQCV